MTFTTWWWSLEGRLLTSTGMDLDLLGLTSSYMMEYEDHFDYDVTMMDTERHDVEYEAMEIDDELMDEDMDSE